MSDATSPADTILTDAFDRVHQQVGSVTDGISPASLAFRADPDANTIAWLIWHLTRVQDTHVADLAGHDPVWQRKGWVDRFGLSLHAGDTGYGASSADVGALDDVTVDLLTGYHEAAHAQSTTYLQGLSAEETERVVDASFDPPVTVGARLVSVIGDCMAHLGQAQYVRGLAERAQA